MYSLLKPFLFQIDPENAHGIIATASRVFEKFPLAPAFLEAMYGYSDPCLALSIAGIQFPNPLGMAAGFDKTGELFPFLSHMGFGHVECGTFTKLKQDGNPRPRLFRFPEQEAIVNRMGFNNPGADGAREILRKLDAVKRRKIIRGINLGKSKLTEISDAAADYKYSLSVLQEFADYITINVSSPNTPGLRQLQEKEKLSDLLSVLRPECKVPLFLKIAPDLADVDVESALDVAKEYCNGIIVCNTTLDKSSIPSPPEGGLSGKPLAKRSLELLRFCRRRLGKDLPIISVGGIDSPESALERILSGASLIQIYTGYIYKGPGLPARILKGIANHCKKEGKQIGDLIGANAI